MSRKDDSTSWSNDVSEAFTSTPKKYQFTCSQCGSAMLYQIGEKSLCCESCGKSEDVQRIDNKAIREYPLAKALQNLKIKPLTPPEKEMECEVCSASFDWDVHRLSGKCPYCHTPITKLDTENNRLQIEAIVPFVISKKEAGNLLEKWLKGRWFAPNVLKEMGGHRKQFDGVYVPHWTFDSLTYTDYRGRRGEYYTVYIQQTRVVSGREETVNVPVRKTRWYAATGSVRVLFDDILVLASMLIPKTIINKLRPWNLDDAEPYTPEYLAGLQSNYYQIDLDEAFQLAKQCMTTEINYAVRRDIGGDVQQIHSKNTQYRNSTYKLIMLPIWYSAFEYREKIFQIVINAQTGKVSGQYPKSPEKIAFAAVIALCLLGMITYFINKGA